MVSSGEIIKFFFIEIRFFIVDDRNQEVLKLFCQTVIASPPGKHDQQINYKSKLLICIDSYRKYLQSWKLWTTDGTWEHSTRLSSVIEILDDKSLDLTTLEAILMNCIVNDIDYLEGAE